jgi:serine/threonine-protein kinase RsbW
MIEVSRRANGIDISFSATVENIDRTDEETRRFLWKMGLETETFAILLSVREGLLNALQHGSSCDPHKIIKYWLRLEDKFLIIEIEDEGNGFDWSAYMRKRAALNSGSGRGLVIMRKYCTHIEYNAKGNRLSLRKEIGERKLPASRIGEQGNVAVLSNRGRMLWLPWLKRLGTKLDSY